MKAYPQLYSLTPLGMQVFEKIFNGDLPDSALVESDRSLVVPVSGTKALEIRTFASAKDMAKAILEWMISLTRKVIGGIRTTRMS